MYQVGVRPSYATGFAQWPGMSEYPQLWEGLVASYAPFLGMTGNKVFDLSGNNNTLTLVNGTNWSAGKFGSVLQFDGTDDAAKNTVPIITGPPFTVVSWFKLDTVSAPDAQGQTVWAHATVDGAPDSDWWRLRIRDSDNLLQYGARVALGGAGNALSTNAVVANRWYQIVCVEVSAAERYLYVDSGNKTSDTTSIAPSNVANHFFQLGRNQADDQNEFDGAIGFTLFYNRSLSASEIAQLYHLMRRLA